MLYTFAKKCISEQGEVEPVKIKKFDLKATNEDDMTSTKPHKNAPR